MLNFFAKGFSSLKKVVNHSPVSPPSGKPGLAIPSPTNNSAGNLSLDSIKGSAEEGRIGASNPLYDANKISSLEGVRRIQLQVLPINRERVNRIAVRWLEEGDGSLPVSRNRTQNQDGTVTYIPQWSKDFQAHLGAEATQAELADLFERFFRIRSASIKLSPIDFAKEYPIEKLLMDGMFHGHIE